MTRPYGKKWAGRAQACVFEWHVERASRVRSRSFGTRFETVIPVRFNRAAIPSDLLPWSYLHKLLVVPIRDLISLHQLSRPLDYDAARHDPILPLTKP